MFQILQDEIVGCRQCPRLSHYIAGIAQVKRRAYRDWDYWGKPVPSFGDPQARVLILGLAPGAHGSNRTGRMFTGDRSGDMLYGVLYKTGFASKPSSGSRGDGLILRDAYITAAAHCAPPGNKPTLGTAQLPPVFRARTRPAEKPEGAGGAGKDRLRYLPRCAQVPRRDPLPRAIRLRPRPPVHHRPRPADPDRFLPPQPAEHLHRQAQREDAARCLPPRPQAGGKI